MIFISFLKMFNHSGFAYTPEIIHVLHFYATAKLHEYRLRDSFGCEWRKSEIINYEFKYQTVLLCL